MASLFCAEIIPQKNVAIKNLYLSYSNHLGNIEIMAKKLQPWCSSCAGLRGTSQIFKLKLNEF